MSRSNEKAIAEMVDEAERREELMVELVKQVATWEKWWPYEYRLPFTPRFGRAESASEEGTCGAYSSAYGSGLQ